MVFGNTLLDPAHVRERLVPSSFQFASHEAVLGIRGIELALSAAGRVLRRLQIALQCAVHFVLSFASSRCAKNAASIAAGCTTRSTSVAMASSTRLPPKLMQRG